MSLVSKAQTSPANNDPNYGATEEEMKQLAIVQEMMAKGELTLDEGIKKILELSGQAGILEVNSDEEEFEEDAGSEEEDYMDDDKEEVPSNKRIK